MPGESGAAEGEVPLATRAPAAEETLTRTGAIGSSCAIDVSSPGCESLPSARTLGPNLHPFYMPRLTFHLRRPKDRWKGETPVNRRHFLKRTTLVGGAAALGHFPHHLYAGPKEKRAQDLVTLGKTGIQVSRLSQGTGTSGFGKAS